MRLLDSWSIDHGGTQKTIQLLSGDLSRLPTEHAVDILVVSAFANDYLTTPTSLIGALARAGISIAALALDKAIDLREQYSCWLSRPVGSRFAFRRILCIESGWRGSPPEITDDLFRALAPYLLADCPNASVAMPLIGSGDQGWPAEQMVESILRAAVSWIQRGLPLSLLKIVTYSAEASGAAHDRFAAIRGEYETQGFHRPAKMINSGNRDVGQNASTPGQTAVAEPPGIGGRPAHYDVFLSYCHRDENTAVIVKRKLEELSPGVRVFFDRTTLRPGGSWLMQIAESLDTSKRVVALYTPDYWSSPSCKDEFAAALARQNDTGGVVLFPIYLNSAQIPYLFRNFQYFDCREGDTKRLGLACSALVESL